MHLCKKKQFGQKKMVFNSHSCTLISHICRYIELYWKTYDSFVPDRERPNDKKGLIHNTLILVKRKKTTTTQRHYSNCCPHTRLTYSVFSQCYEFNTNFVCATCTQLLLVLKLLLLSLRITHSDLRCECVVFFLFIYNTNTHTCL